jgi:hypothetical protein
VAVALVARACCTVAWTGGAWQAARWLGGAWRGWLASSSWGGAMRARRSEEQKLTSVWAGFSRLAGFSRFGFLRENSARAVRRFGRKFEEKIDDSERSKRNWG